MFGTVSRTVVKRDEFDNKKPEYVFLIQTETQFKLCIGMIKEK